MEHFKIKDVLYYYVKYLNKHGGIVYTLDGVSFSIKGESDHGEYRSVDSSNDALVLNGNNVSCGNNNEVIFIPFHAIARVVINGNL